jgi:hypothetical protein
MTFKTLAAACAAVCALSATGALAAEPITVKLSAPVAQPVKLIAGGAMFDCQGDACVAQATMSGTYATDTCKAIAAKVGQVAAFEGRRTFDNARLADCNTVAAKATSGQMAAK